MLKSYEQLITVLETLPVDQCSMEFDTSRLLSEDVKRQYSGGAKVLEPGLAFAGKSGNFPFKCHGCGMPGHKRVDCPDSKWSNASTNRAGEERMKTKKKNGSGAHSAETERNDVAFVGDEREAMHSGVNEFRWVLDSGASEHLVNSKKLSRERSQT